MSFKKEANKGQAWLRVEGALTIYEADELRQEMLSCLSGHKGLVLDLEAVSDCDIAGIQLLCSARTTAAEMEKTFVVKRASATVLDSVSRAGIDPEEFLDVEKA